MVAHNFNLSAVNYAFQDFDALAKLFTCSSSIENKSSSFPTHGIHH